MQLGKISTLGINSVTLALVAQAIILFVFIYVTLRQSEYQCIEVFGRPHEQHKMRIKPRRNIFPLGELEPNDLEKLINLTSFRFVQNHVCTATRVFLLVLIPSAPENKNNREIIRSTWGRKNEDVKILFMFGLVKDQKSQELLKEENQLYGDIIQGNFLDTYKNLTYKTVMSLKYVIYYCSQATYILKVDDDSYVNMLLLLNFLKHDISPFGAENLFLCNDMTRSPVIRDNTSKWYIPEDEFPYKHFPSYCSGWYAIFSPDVCFKLYKESQKIRYMFIEDAFVYGIAANKSHLTHTDMEYFTLAFRNPNLLFNGTYDDLPILFGAPNMNPELIKRFYEYFTRKPVPESIFRKFGRP